MSNPADRRCRNQCDSEWLVHDDPECPLFEGAADRPATEPRILLEEALSWALPDEAMPHVDLHVVAGDLIHLLLERDLRLTTMTAAQEDALREGAAEAEAARGAASLVGGLDLEALRMERGWPTPISMRHAADALDKLAIPKYGDVLRWVADLCDGAAPRAEGLDAIAFLDSLRTPRNSLGKLARPKGHMEWAVEEAWVPPAVEELDDTGDGVMIHRLSELADLIIDRLQARLSRPSDERVPESECKRFRHDEHCDH